MKVMASFAYQQKKIAVELLGNTVILLVFVLCLVWHRGPRNLASLLLMLSWYLPILYSVLKIHTTDDTRIDERDRQIEDGGIRSGYVLLSIGIWYILRSADDTAHLLNELFIVWMLSRIVANGKQLRLYAGHSSWLPDSFVERRHRRARNRIVDASLSEDERRKEGL